MPEQNISLLLDDAKMIFRNLSGAARPPYNVEGDRNFSVVINPDLAQKLLDEGWRVKKLKDRVGEDGETIPGDYHLKVKLNYSHGRPPRVVLISSTGRTELGANEVALIDALDIDNARLFVNGWWSDMAGGGYSAFLKTALITMKEDPLEQEYAKMLQDARADLVSADD